MRHSIYPDFEVYNQEKVNNGATYGYMRKKKQFVKAHKQMIFDLSDNMIVEFEDGSYVFYQKDGRIREDQDPDIWDLLIVP